MSLVRNSARLNPKKLRSCLTQAVRSRSIINEMSLRDTALLAHVESSPSNSRLRGETRHGGDRTADAKYKRNRSRNLAFCPDDVHLFNRILIV